jgi:flavin reductase (DIM6/NTAB) family NADH-FMN oxidoreductase RutF
VREFADVIEKLDRELWVVTARDGKRSSGLVATYASSVSLVPDLPRVTIALAKHHYTHELIKASGAFAMHLVDDTQIDWVWRFGIPTGRDVDKFQGLATTIGTSGSPILEGAPAWIDCRVETRLDTGDRTIFLAEVLNAGCRMPGAEQGVLTFKRLVKLASKERLNELKTAMERDIEIDRAAILKWRQIQGIVGEPFGTCP